MAWEQLQTMNYSFFCKPRVCYTLIAMFTIRTYNLKRKNLHGFPIFANVSSFPSNLNRKVNVQHWAECKYHVARTSVLLGTRDKVFLTFPDK